MLLERFSLIDLLNLNDRLLAKVRNMDQQLTLKFYRTAVMFSIIVVLITGCATTQREPTGSQKAVEPSGAKPELTNLSNKLSKGIIANGIKKIAILDFVDLQGRTTELGRYLAEQLSVEMVNEEDISVVDRANINSILAEHKLTMLGLVDPENAKALGKFAGIDAILIGTVTTLDGDIVLTVKAIATETAQIVAAVKATFKSTSELHPLSTRVASSATAVSASAETNSTGKVVYPDANAIATKDIGDLRVVLKSICSVKGEYGFQQVQMVFDFINTNLNKNVLIVAVSAKNWSGNIIQSQLIDSIGQTWVLSRISGLSNVRGGGEVNREQIAQYVMNGKHMSEGAGFYNTNDKPWWGGFTEIPAIQSNRVTMLFSQTGNANNSGNNTIADSFQFECELIIGKGSPEQPENCSFTTLMFDDVSLSKK